MVRFCKNCKRAIDDLDKFCRECGHDTKDSYDYHTYYDLFLKTDVNLKNLKEKEFLTAEDVEQSRKELEKNIKALSKVKQEDFFHVLSKEEIEQELSRIEKEFGMSPEEFYKAWQEGKINDINATKLGYYYEIYLEDYKRPFGKKNEEKLEIGGEEEGRKEENEKLEIGGEEEGRKEENENHEYDLKKIKLYTFTDDIKLDDINWNWPETDEGKGESDDRHVEIPKEVEDKLGLLLQEDRGHKDAIQYLINRYSKEKEKNPEEENSQEKTKDIILIPKEDVIVGRVKGTHEEEPYKMYEKAIHNFIPDILEKIEHSKDGIIRIKLKDLANQMGEQFVEKRPVTLYTGLKYTLFDHNIFVQMGSLKDIDPTTGKNVKVLLMRMKNPSDKLPPSMLQRRIES